MNQIAISPDGARIALVTQRGDQKLVCWFNVDDKKIRTLPIGAKKVRNLFWADNDQVVLVTSVTAAVEDYNRERREFQMAQIVNLDQSKVAQIFSDVAGFNNIIAGDLQRVKINDQYRVTASAYKTVGDYNLYLYSFGTADHMSPKQMDDGTIYTERWVVTPSGVPMGYADFDDEDNLKDKSWTLYFNTAGTNPPHYKKIYTLKGGHKLSRAPGTRA